MSSGVSPISAPPERPLTGRLSGMRRQSCGIFSSGWNSMKRNAERSLSANMKTALITGAAGLIGSEAARFFCQQGFEVVGIDNDLRAYFFGKEGSTRWNLAELQNECPRFCNHAVDIRDVDAVSRLFAEYGKDIALVIHAAAQPSHDWAAREPLTDFGVNALGTLNMLASTRKYCPEAVFIFTSTNKVYGDNPNRLPLVELETRWEVAEDH